MYSENLRCVYTQVVSNFETPWVYKDSIGHTMRTIITLLLLLLTTFSGYANTVDFDHFRLPDFRLNMQPYELDQQQAFQAMVQAGPKTVWAEATYGFDFWNEQMVKTTVAYQAQKLGFSFYKGHTHRWDQQWALGFVYEVPPCMMFNRFVDIGGAIYHSNSRTLTEVMVPFIEGFNQRRLAGACGCYLKVEANCGIWETGIQNIALFYDYAKFNRKYHHDKSIQGFGIRYSLYQDLWDYGDIELNFEYRAPFIAYSFRYLPELFKYNENTSISLFGERVHGRHQVANSSRLGIQIDFAFGGTKYRTISDDFFYFLKRLAVDLPTVVVIKDQIVTDF